MREFHSTILQVVPRLNAGGAERTTVEIAGAIVRAGGRALVASAGGAFEADIVKAGGELIDMPVDAKDPLSIVANARRLTTLIRSENVDLIHARSRAPAWSAAMAAQRAKIPYVTTFHGAHDASNALKRWYNSSLVKGDAIIANSHFTAEKVSNEYNFSADHLHVIPRGADVRYFDPMAITEARINHISESWALGSASHGLRLLLPARLTAWKGHELAIDAAAELNSLGPSGKARALTLVFCGGAQPNSDYEETLRAKIDQRGVREMVHLVGNCADMPAAYGWADVVLSPSVRPEPFGRTIVEAGAMGKPVIAAGHGGALETVIDGQTGILFKPGDVLGLSRALERFSKMPAAERNAMGENAAARVRTLYSTDIMCDATLRVYEGLLKKGNQAGHVRA
ncbi:MAG: glycosyltransferase family 4 protein [Pseudomonadota bacterium]